VKEHTDALLGNSSRFEFPRRARVFDITLEPFRTSQNQMVGCVRLALDSTERKKSEAHMRHQATHDGLTGLFNYRAFCDALEREVVRSERSRGTFSLLLLDCE
jgi:PleD family two-component response regulator